MIYLQWFAGDVGFLLAFDATVNETHRDPVSVTDHPVGTGINVTDHVRKAPTELQFDWRVSDTPVPAQGWEGDSFFSSGEGRIAPAEISYTRVRYSRDSTALAGQLLGLSAPGIPAPISILGARRADEEVRRAASVWQWDSPFSRVYDVYQALIGLQQNATLLRISTPIRDYENFILSDLTVSRDQTSGTAPAFSGSFRELQIVSSETIELPQPREPRGERRKNKGAQKTKPAAEGETVRKSILDNALNSEPAEKARAAWTEFFTF